MKYKQYLASENLKRHLTVKKIMLLVIALLVLYYLVNKLFPKPTPTVPLPPVSVQKPVVTKMAEYVTQTGTLVASNSVNLVARIEGTLDGIEFVDGTYVKKGQNLFVIQPEPYMEKLKAAQASLAAQKASNTYSQAEYTRQQRMYKQNATSLNNVEKWLARTEQTKSQVAEAAANATLAAINYSYTHIVAPFDGRMGRHLVDAGNLVGHGEATNLATIEQIDKLYVYFNFNEIDLVRLRAALMARGFKASDINKIVVDIALQNNEGYQYKAHLDFFNTGLNSSTGTMELRAVLDNKKHIFVPGLFVQVRIPITSPTKQLTIPDTAILYDQIGPYIYTANKDNIVILKRVSLGGINNGKRAITKGLKTSDRVIVAGVQNVTPGNKVEIVPNK